MRKGLVLLLGLVFVIGVAGLSYAAISGSKHDFTSDGGAPWTSLTQICSPCHVPHRSRAVGGVGSSLFKQTLLWGQTARYDATIWTNTAFWYTTWTGATVDDSVVGRCMGCHIGGEFWLTSVTAGSGAQITSTANLGTTLVYTHPVGIQYDLSGYDKYGAGGFVDIANVPFAIKLIGTNKLVGCRSCHDPHNSVGVSYFLVLDNADSALCTGCHNK